MQRTTLSGMIFGLLLLCGGVLFASEADELRERAKAMRKEASVIAERGNKEQAEQLEKESVKLLEAAERMELKAKGQEEKGDRPGIDKEIRHLKERLQDLLANEKKMREAKAPEKELAEVREQIAVTERELHSIHAHHAGKGKLPPKFHAQAEKLEAASRRIHHLRVAAESLKMAEAHDLAHQLTEKAEAMEREFQEGKKRLAAELQKAHGAEHGPDVVRQLKEEIERLRAEVKELRQKVEKR
jgi:DNA repair exonuclease SbcCD ATPase subunit